MTTTKYGILLDLDETLVRTSAIETLRDRDDWERAREQFSKTWLPPGTREFLCDAARLGSVGIVTSSPGKKYAEPLLAYHNLSDIRVLIASEEARYPRQKPQPHPILKAAEKIGCDPRYCVYIGDTWSDMEAAWSAHAVPIGIQWPDQPPRGEALNAWRICSTWDEVMQVIRDLIADDFTSVQKMWLSPHSETKWWDRRLSVFDYYTHYPNDAPQHLYATHTFHTTFPDNNAHRGSYLISLLKNAGEEIPMDGHTPDARVLATAYRDVAEAAISAVRRYERVLQDDLRCGYIVSAPRHVAGVLSNSNPCERLAGELATTFPWLTHLPGALARTEAIRQSHGLTKAERPTVQEHIDSIKYIGPKLPPPVGGIILLDDVLTYFTTSDACRTLLERDTGCSTTVGLFIGRTVHAS